MAPRAGGGFAGAGHGDAFLSGVAPAGGEGGVWLAFAGEGEFTQACEVGAGVRVGDAVDGQCNHAHIIFKDPPNFGSRRLGGEIKTSPPLRFSYAEYNSSKSLHSAHE